jgi:hypothetical protein
MHAISFLAYANNEAETESVSHRKQYKNQVNREFTLQPETETRKEQYVKLLHKAAYSFDLCYIN